MHTRRVFLGATAATLSVAGGIATDAAATSPYDFASIEQRLTLPFRHRQAFGTHAIADNAIGGFMLNSLNAYDFDYAEGPGTLHALGIFYGTSVAMLLDDAAWRKYKIATVQQRRGDFVKHADVGDANPHLHPTSSLDPRAERTDLHGLYHDVSLTALAKRKASFFACNNALSGLATDIAVTYGFAGEPPGVVLSDLHKHLISGTLLVPAGVAAVNQAQEMKFTFMQASV